jgi:succinoglycan biosynthesis transport protein ExoP
MYCAENDAVRLPEIIMQNTDLRESLSPFNGTSQSLTLSQLPAPPTLRYETASEGEDKVHLLDYLRAIRKHLWLVCGITLLATMAATIYLVRKPDLFEAQALVQVDLEEVNPAIGAASKNNAVIVNNTINDPAYFNTQLRLLSSTALLRRVVKTLDLENNQGFLNRRVSESNKWWQRLGGGGYETRGAPQTTPTDLLQPGSTLGDGATATQDEIEETRRLSPFVKDITKDLRIEPVIEKRLGYSRDSTRLIEIQFTYPDPQLAAKIVNNIADVFVLLNLERKAEANVSTGNFLQKRVAELQAQIRGGEERLINYAQNHQILSLNAEQNTVVERLIGLNRQLLDAENKRKLAEAAYQAAMAPDAASALAEETASRQLYEMESRLADARQRYAQLLVENTEDWPEVRESKQQVLTLEEEIKRARNRSTNVVLKNHETQYRQAQATEQSLRKAFDQQRRETLAQNEAAINYRIIQQEIETNKNLLDGLLQRYKENDVVLAGMRNNIHVIDYALTSEKPVGPRRFRGIALVLVFSLIFGACLAIFLEYLNNTVRTPEDVERTLHLPVLVSIPTVSALRNNNSQAKGLFDAEAGSMMAESYRQLRTAVLLSTPGHAPRRLLVTSCLPSEGKTTTAVNLAVCLAQTKNAKVLIIDADMRRPRLRRLFKLTDRPGLSSYLSSDMSEEELLGLVTKHDETGLCVMTSGPVPPNPAELLSSEQMRGMLESLEQHFTHIIIDSPPGASFTDAVLISPMVDGVLMVVHSGKTPQEVVRRLRQLLTAAGGRIFGVVLNQVDMMQSDYYYYAGHYRQNGSKNGGPVLPTTAQSSTEIAASAASAPDEAAPEERV